MGRLPCCSKEGMNRGAWTEIEDNLLRDYIRVYGEGRWRKLPQVAGLKRCGKSCRLRWLNYLRPGIKRGNITLEEEDLIIRLHKLLGNRWSLIAGRLPGRTDNEIKNYWNTNLSKRVNNSHLTPPTSTHSHKQPSKSKKKKTLPIMAEPKPNSNSNVVWPKASKCSEAFFNQQQHCENYEDVSICGNSERTRFENPKGGLMSISPIGADNHSEFGTDLELDFGIDLDVGEFCLTEFLNSDFQQLCEEERKNKDDRNIIDDYNFSSSFVDQLFSSDDENVANCKDEQCRRQSLCISQK